MKILLTDRSVSCTISFVQIIYRDKTWDVKGGMTARDAIKKIGLDPESVLVVVNEVLVTDDVVLKEQDQIKLVAVVSGGERENS